MRHLNSGRKLKRTASHRRALMRSLATALFEHKRIETTEAKAKELRSYAEKLITKAKDALARERQGLLPEGQKIDIHNRRLVGREIQNKGVLQELFDAIAPVVESRAGGYTRVVKTGFRRGDGGRTAIIEMVDWSNPQDGATSLKTKKKAKKAKPKATASAAPKAEAAPAAPKAEVKEEPQAPVTQFVDEGVNEMDTTETTQDIHLKQDDAELQANADEPVEGPADVPGEEEEPKA